jgi:hypothetical protein
LNEIQEQIIAKLLSEGNAGITMEALCRDMDRIMASAFFFELLGE